MSSSVALSPNWQPLKFAALSAADNTPFINTIDEPTCMTGPILFLR